ncbi:MAG: tetratricopeptide repeat protein, partial [Planctomycetota bacterium]
RAILDYDKAIELAPNVAFAYFGRGLAYGNKGQYDRAILDLKTAAQLGDMSAQKFLRENGIAW